MYTTIACHFLVASLTPLFVLEERGAWKEKITSLQRYNHLKDKHLVKQIIEHLLTTSFPHSFISFHNFFHLFTPIAFLCTDTL